jgi:hypothetical protein
LLAALYRQPADWVEAENRILIIQQGDKVLFHGFDDNEIMCHWMKLATSWGIIMHQMR